MNDFDALLAELAPLAKAMEAAEGDTVQQAAAEAGADGGKKPDEAAEEAGQEEEKDDELMGKSFAVTMPDGTVQEAYDGTAMMKAMATRLEGLTASRTSLEAELAATKGDLAKALSASTGLLGLVRTQGTMLKALESTVAAIGNQGRGRQAHLTPHDKPGLSAPTGGPDKPSNEQVMAKAMTLHAAGELSSIDVARIEGRLNNGQALPPDLSARLAA